MGRLPTTSCQPSTCGSRAGTEMRQFTRQTEGRNPGAVYTGQERGATRQGRITRLEGKRRMPSPHHKRRLGQRNVALSRRTWGRRGCRQASASPWNGPPERTTEQPGKRVEVGVWERDKWVEAGFIGENTAEEVGVRPGIDTNEGLGCGGAPGEGKRKQKRPSIHKFR